MDAVLQGKSTTAEKDSNFLLVWVIPNANNPIMKL